MHFPLIQIELTSEGKLGFDTRLAALLVLVISASLFDEHNYDIPCTIFSYVVTFLGRISHALRDVMTQDDLLAYLSQRSKSTREAEQCLDSAVGGLPDDASEELNNLAVMPFQKCGTSKIQSPLMKEPSSMETSLVEYHLNVHDDLLRSINTILAKVRDVWPLVVSGNINKVLRTLRLDFTVSVFYIHAYILLWQCKGHPLLAFFIGKNVMGSFFFE